MRVFKSTATILPTSVSFSGPAAGAAIMSSVGDHDGPIEVPARNRSGRCSEVIFCSPVPSLFAVKSEVSPERGKLRIQANRLPSGEKVIGVSTSSITFRGVPPNTGIW